MSNKLMFISFYTKDTIYEKIINNRLIPSLKLFNLSHWIKPIDNRGNWAKNTCQKPAVILEALNKFKDCNIVWIDADAEIKEYPLLLLTMSLYGDCDIGVHYLKWSDHYGRPSDKGRTELIDGTIFVRNNQKMRDFILEWKKNSTDKEINHQKVLEKMIEKRKDIKVYDFGREYCYIETTSFGKKPAIEIEHPVIVHYQASRIGRRKLK